MANLRGQKIFVDPAKKSPCREWVCQVLFGKNWKKICQIWPRRPLKHFTAAYRGFPPCTQSQPPINRETGYSNVLILWGQPHKSRQVWPMTWDRGLRILWLRNPKICCMHFCHFVKSTRVEILAMPKLHPTVHISELSTSSFYHCSVFDVIASNI